MRKRGWIPVIAVTVAVLAACGEPPSPELERASDFLFFRSSRGVAVFEAGTSNPTFTAGTSVTNSDWSTVIETEYIRGVTELTAVVPRTGAERWTESIAGRWQPKIVSEDGTLVALGPLNERHYRVGRAATTLLVAGSGIPEPRTVFLNGNYEPEAFSTDGQSIFVIKYLPARNPTKYQVRRLDLRTDRVLGVYTPHDELQEVMGGTARIQAASPDERRLYTLYTVGGRGSSSYAFIHVLALDELWAHCIALPREFAQAAESSSAIAVSPDGQSIYLANARADMVAVIDATSLQVERTAEVLLPDGGTPQAAVDKGGDLYFSAGREMVQIDTEELTLKDDWGFSDKVTGVQPGAGETKVYVGMKRDVAVIETATGDMTGTFDPPGVGRIDQLGSGMRTLEDDLVKG